MPTWTNGLTREENIIDWQGKRIAELEAGLAELKELVMWERECDAFGWSVLRNGVLPKFAVEEILASFDASRAAVDEILAGEL